jgi:hypothetical protein
MTMASNYFAAIAVGLIGLWLVRSLLQPDLEG